MNLLPAVSQVCFLIDLIYYIIRRELCAGFMYSHLTLKCFEYSDLTAHELTSDIVLVLIKMTNNLQIIYK